MTTDMQGPMDLGAIYGRTFTLIRRTPGLAIIIFLIIVAVSILYGYGNMMNLAVQADLAASGGPGADEAAQEEAMKAFFGAMVPFFFFMVIFFFGITFAQVAATIGGWEALNDRPVSTGDVLARSIRRPFWVSILQTIIFMMVMVTVGIIVGIVSFIAAGANTGRIGLIFAILFTLACAYPIVATSFRIHKVALESRGPWQGMIASIAMVKGYFWRTFGVLFLLGIAMVALSLIISYAMGISPMMGGGMGGGSNDIAAQAAELQKMKESYTWPVVIVQALQFGLSFTFMYYLLTPLYADLRIRRGELRHVDDDEEYEEADDRSWGDTGG